MHLNLLAFKVLPKTKYFITFENNLLAFEVLNNFYQIVFSNSLIQKNYIRKVFFKNLKLFLLFILYFHFLYYMYIN